MLAFETYQHILYRVAGYHARRYFFFNFEVDELVAEGWIRLYLRDEPKTLTKAFGNCRRQVGRYIAQQVKSKSRRVAVKAGRIFPQQHLLNEIDEKVVDASPDDFWDYIAEELSRAQILILKLYFIEGYHFSEIANILGTKPSTAYTHYQRACLKLRGKLGLYLESLQIQKGGE